jgi:hypothetical protein
MAVALRARADEAERMGQSWRRQKLEISWLLSPTERYGSFDAVTAYALEVALVEAGSELTQPQKDFACAGALSDRRAPKKRLAAKLPKPQRLEKPRGLDTRRLALLEVPVSGCRGGEQCLREWSAFFVAPSSGTLLSESRGPGSETRSGPARHPRGLPASREVVAYGT